MTFMIAVKAHGAHSEPLFQLGFLEINSSTVTTWIIMLILTVFCLFMTRDLKVIPSSKRQLTLEAGIIALVDFLGSVMGSRKVAQTYFPVIGSFFLIILAGNYSGLLPGAGSLPGFQPPTGTLSYCAGLAVAAFIYTHFCGVRKKGIKYFAHFISPSPLLLPMNVLEELIRPLSLTLRLYGNIYGEEILLASVIAMIPVFVPLPFMFLSMLFGFIQAAVFTILSSTYVATAVSGH